MSNMRRKFSWEYFDTDFIRSIVYSNRTSKNLRPIREYDDKLLMLPIMDRICTKPDDHFVRHYRKEITEHFLAGSPHLVSIMKELEKRRFGSVRLDSMEHMLEQFNQLRLTSTVLTLIIHELRQVGYLSGGESPCRCLSDAHRQRKDQSSHQVPLVVHGRRGLAGCLADPPCYAD